MPDPLLDRFKTILERFLLVWLVLLCGAAYWWTVWFPGTGAFDPFVASAGCLPYLIFCFAQSYH